MKLTELQTKEVIVIDDGKRLGFIGDLEIDPEKGLIIAIIIFAREKKGGLFGRQDEVVVYWDQIVTIGQDIILVNAIQESRPFVETPLPRYN